MKKFLFFMFTLVCFTCAYAQGAYRIPRKYGDYIPPSDLELAERIGREKDRIYNYNYNLIYNYIDELNLTIQNKATEYSKEGKTFNNSQVQLIKNIYINLNSILNSDLSYNSNARQGISYIKGVINTIQNW